MTNEELKSTSTQIGEVIERGRPQLEEFSQPLATATCSAPVIHIKHRGLVLPAVMIAYFFFACVSISMITPWLTGLTISRREHIDGEFATEVGL